MKNLTLLLLAGLLAFAGCASDESVAPTAPAPDSEEILAPAGEGETLFHQGDEATGDIVETAIAAGFSTLATAVTEADLVETLQSDGPFTVFAPTNQAFDDLPEGLLAALLLPENKAKLQQILLYHVISGAAVESRDLRFYQRVETAEGSDVEILKFWRLIKVNDSRVTLADVPATNGVIHVINKVLVPPGFTLEDPPEPTADIVDTAIGAGFDTLVAAVQAAMLEEALRGEGPLTVFAPNEQAFANLPSALLTALLQPENKPQLQELLTYHVVAGEVRSTDLRRFQFVKMLNDGYTFVRKNRAGEVRINRADVVAADILATNGVVHVIDEVLIPYSFFGFMPGLPAEAPADHPEREKRVSNAN